MLKNKSYIWISFVILVFGILVVPKIVERIENNEIVKGDRLDNDSNSSKENGNLEKIGPVVENAAAFPRRTNTEFIELVDRSHVKMRVWERGSGETMACGTGACAAVVAGVLNNHNDRKTTVKLTGGELSIEWRAEDNHVYLTGSATTVFEGEI